MKKTKVISAKRSLVMSVLSLMLCFAMLLGTTYAWFTDSVTSGKNKIVAGNLDVELTHSNALVSDEDVQDSTDLFKFEKVNDTTYKDVLWEPGMVVYENFTVSNVGNLALKYALSLNVFDKNTYNDNDLTDVIKVAVVDGGFTGDRAAAQDITGFQTLSDFQKQGHLLAKGSEHASDTYGVVLYWEPTNNDNLYNVNNGGHTSDNEPLFVEFGITLVATQDTVEADSFDNQYDKWADTKIDADGLISAYYRLLPTSTLKTEDKYLEGGWSCANNIYALNPGLTPEILNANLDHSDYCGHGDLSINNVPFRNIFFVIVGGDKGSSWYGITEFPGVKVIVE